jgi:hypothetical protein
MATFPIFRKPDGGPQPPEPPAPRRLRVKQDPFQLRPIPMDDVYFFCKHIDNGRLEREPDPRSGSRCWSAIGVACLALGFLTGVLAPKEANTLAGYQLESLRAHELQLREQQRALELQEAELVSPQNLEQFARERNLTLPQPGQVSRLEPKDDPSLAMVKQ